MPVKPSKLIIFFCVIFSLALYSYSSRIVRNKHYGKVFFKLGLQCQDECSPKKKFRYFKKAIYHDPNLFDAYYHMGVIYGQQKNYGKEIEYYEKAIKLDHNNADAYLKVGLYYFQKGEFDYAIRYLLQFDSLVHDRYDIYHFLAQAYEKSEIYEKALDWYSYLIIGSVPHLAEACENIWRISKVPGQYDMVLEYIQAFVLRGHVGLDDIWKSIEESILLDKIPECIWDYTISGVN